MNEWLILPKILPKPNRYQIELKNDKYFLCGNFQLKDYFYSEKEGTGIFVDGYILPELANPSLKCDAEFILDEYKKNKINFIKNFKGHFTLIIIDRSDIYIFIDHFGVIKVFYSIVDSYFYASNSIFTLIKYIDAKISIPNVLEYLLLNYFVTGKTIFKNIKYGLGGKYYKIDDKITENDYFSVNNFIDTEKYKKTNIDQSKKFWVDILKQYAGYFGSHELSMALTAGLDSRMILSGLRYLGLNPNTFTFGEKKSIDVTIAEKIANKLNLVHHHYYPDGIFFNTYSNLAKETVITGNTLVSSYRTHRYDAYKKHKQFSNAIIWGFAGSEVIRGLYPDGLLISDFIKFLWLNGNQNIKAYIENFFKLHYINLEKKQSDELIEQIINYKFLNNPREYLFNIIIPCHFSQDINLLHSLGIQCICPYWDLNFLRFLNSQGVLISNDRKDDYARQGHFRRRFQPMFSSKIIAALDVKCSSITLGKGYTPKDYAFSSYYSGLKYFLYRQLNKKVVPNFSYGNWYHSFLCKYIEENNFDFLRLNKHKSLNDLKLVNANDEYGFLFFTKLINLDIAKTF